MNFSNSNSGAISVTNATIQRPSEASPKKLSILLRELRDVLGIVLSDNLGAATYFIELIQPQKH